MSWQSGYELIILKGNNRGSVIPLMSKSIQLGRHYDGAPTGPEQIYFQEGTVSRVHAVIEWLEEEQAFLLYHRSKTNDTLVNGKQVRKTLLKPGDKIQMGFLVIQLKATSQATPSPKEQPASDLPKKQEQKTNLFQEPTQTRSKSSFWSPPTHQEELPQETQSITAKSSPSSQTRKQERPPTQAPRNPLSEPSAPAIEANTIAGNNTRDDDNEYFFKILAGPNQSQELILSALFSPLGREDGPNDTRKKRGIILSDPQLEPDEGLLIWDPSQETYSLTSHREQDPPITIQRMAHEEPESFALSPHTPTPLVLGDIIQLGSTTLIYSVRPKLKRQNSNFTKPVTESTPPSSRSSFSQESQEPTLEKPPEASPQTVAGQAPAYESKPLTSASSPPVSDKSSNPPLHPVTLTSTAKTNLARGALNWVWKDSYDWVLEFLSGPITGQHIPFSIGKLKDGQEVYLGSGQPSLSNQVTIPDETLLPKHAVLSFQQNNFSISNEGEPQSVLVNNLEVTPGASVLLLTGDIISIGQSSFRLLSKEIVQALSPYYFVIESGVPEDQGKTYYINSQRFLVGRGKNSHLQLNDLETSRSHLCLSFYQGQFKIEHRSSTNPTFINGVQVSQSTPAPVKPGDRVRLSSLTVLRFMVDSSNR